MFYAEWLPRLAPPWLQDTNGRAFLTAVGNLLDEQRAALVEGVKARFPDAAPVDALAYIGADRQLDRGPADNDVTYAARLRGAWDTWKAAGNHGALLRQLQIAGFTGEKFIVQRNGRRSSIAADVVTFTDGPPWTFNSQPITFYNQFGILFTGALPTVTYSGGVWSTDAETINRLALMWRPGKARFMGTFILGGDQVWGWPVTRAWGTGGITWGGSAARFIPPPPH